VMLQDMEFIQFVLRHMKDPGVPPRIPPVEQFLLSGADLLNAKGRSVLKWVDSFTRDSIARAAAKAIEEEHAGNEGFVYLDLRNFRNTGTHNISNLTASTIRVFPAAHFFMGGVRVRDNLSTSIEGLYVAGEIMGGVHGANRLGGNALAEAFVFGGKAGYLAARFAKQCSANPVSPAYAVCALENQTAVCFGARSKPSILPDISRLIGDLGTIMSTDAGVLRSRNKLDGGLLALEKLRSALSQLPPPTPRDLWNWFDLSHSLTVAEMIFTASLEREESRGAHYRHDYPHKDDEKWLVNICISKSPQERMEISRAPVSSGC